MTTANFLRVVRLTPVGRGAVASLVLHGTGPDVDRTLSGLFQAANGRAISAQPIRHIVFGHWGRTSTEEVVVTRQSETTVEIHCHGGEAAVRRILSDLQQQGVELCSAWQFGEETRGRFATECDRSLSLAPTLRTASLLLAQADAWPAAVRRWSEISWTSVGRAQLQHELEQVLAWSPFALHLTSPWNIVLAGRPNVGKSSLINALVGYTRSIVYDRPGTTRDVVTANTALDGWPVRLADTAGLRAAEENLEAAGIERAQVVLAAADCQVLLFDGSQPLTESDVALCEQWPAAIFVAHKSDLPGEWPQPLPGAWPVSSLTGSGLEELIATVVQRLVPQVPEPGTPLPFTPRLVDEISRALAAVAEGDRPAFTDSLAAMCR